MKKLVEEINEDWKKTAMALGTSAALLTGGSNAIAAGTHNSSSYRASSDSSIVAKVIAGEAAGEGEEGMRAVACVIQNRGGDPVAVVTKRSQFDILRHPEVMKRNYLAVKGTADRLASEIGRLTDITGGAKNYVTRELYNREKNNRKSWIGRMKVTKVIGQHVFLKEV